jgi:hypothetical protein
MRAPLRGWSNPSDFILVYAPARAWLLGANPYDAAQIDQVWLEASGPGELRPSSRNTPELIYPPTTLLMFVPWAALPWPAAHYAWLAANVAFVGLIIWFTARVAGFGLRQRRTWVFVAAILVFAPMHTAIHHGQTPLYVLAMALLAFAVRSQAASGVALGLASAVKPHLALPFAALEAVRGRWRSAVIAAATLAAILLASILPLLARGVPWLTSWRNNLAAFRAGGAGDPSSANPHRHQLVNLQYPITALTGNTLLAEILTFAIVALLAMIFFLPPAKRMRSTPLLLSLSMVAVLTLMLVNHRFYDAVLLLIPLAWAINAAALRPRDALPWCVLALLVPFFLNAATALHWFADAGRLPGWLIEGWWWERLLLPHQGWAILGIAIVLLIAQRTHRRSAPTR